MKLLMLLFTFISFLSVVMSSDIKYSNLTQGEYHEVTVDVSITSLNHLFVMSRQFVDVVFRPFSVIEEFIFDLIVESKSNNFIQDLLANWQKLASFEAGFVTCLVFGLLFIILVPIVGCFMFCCRTCCNNCGGEMEQSHDRAGSKWRHCFCVSLFIISIFIAVPCIFVFLTNEWVTQVINVVPQKTSDTLDDVITYVDVVPVQLKQIVGQYGKLDDELRNDVNDLGTKLGVPIRDIFKNISDPSFNQLMSLMNDSKDALTALNDTNEAVTSLTNGMTALNNRLNNVKSELDGTLSSSACNAISQCTELQGTTSGLNPSGADFSSLGSLQPQIDALTQVLSYDISGEITKVNAQLDDIPEMVTNGSADARQQIFQTLDQVNETLAKSLETLPLEPIEQLKSTVDSLNSSIANGFATYSNYDIYRYIAGVVLGSIVAVIVVCYLLGIALGTFGFDKYPNERSGASNCGGIILMAGVGFSFIFSWLLMILVSLSFTVGGHGERYICQNFETPYEGLKFTDRVLIQMGISSNILPGLNLSAFDIINNCKNNQSAYTAFQLEQVFNVTEIVENATEKIKSFQDNLDSVSVNLSSIEIYTPDIAKALNSMRDADLAGVDFESYLSQVNTGLTSSNLTGYAEDLNVTADAIASANLSLANAIRGHSYSILSIQTNYVDPLTEDLKSLNANVLSLQSLSIGLEASINKTEDELKRLDNDIQTKGADMVKNQTIVYADELVGEINGYTRWLEDQINNHFGACRPLYLVYAQVVSLLCDYLMDVLNGLWFSLGWCVFFLIPGAILGMKLAKFFRKMKIQAVRSNDEHWNELEMDAFNQTNNGKNGGSSTKFRSGKVHPGDYY